MPFEILRMDITNMNTDAVVNAANHSLLGGGGVDGAIHKAAGPLLLEECKTLGGCKTGESKISKGYNLPADYVIHTVGPIWKGGAKGEEKLLRACYRSALDLALEKNLESIAFPLISSGVFGYPKDQAMQVALSVISEFLMDHEMMIYLVVYDQKAFILSEKLFASVKAFINDNYVEEHEILDRNTDYEMQVCNYSSSSSKRCLDDVLEELQETFSEHLIRMIDLKGKTDVETYKRANVDRKLFSKIRSDKYYRPSKTTVIAFSIALELNHDETKDLLEKAGFALSRSSKFDLIVEYFISEGNFNIHEINEALFAFDQPLLGV